MNRPVPDDVPEGIGFGWWHPDSDVYPSPEKYHKGKDYRAVKGTPCWFREPGIIIFAGLLGELGLYCQMQAEADSSRFWGLAHLSQIDARFGQHVFAGEPVGLTGGVPGEYGSGKSTGSHLHEEVRVTWRWGERVDPDSVLEEDMDRAKLENALNRLWLIREAFSVGGAHTPEFAMLSEKLFDIVVDIKVATGLQ